jgi:hypothetical protein
VKFNLDANATTTPKTQGEAPFSAEQCDALFAAVLVHDEVHPDAELPDAIPIDYDQEQLARCYRVSRQIWEQGVDRQALVAITRKIRRYRSLSPEDQLLFKHVRARFKHLRAAYIATDEGHRHPGALQALTAVMGFLQDAFKHDRGAAMTWWAMVLRLFLTRYLYAWMTRSVYDFRTGDAESFRQYVEAEMHFVRLNLAKDEITSKDFHEMRKVVSRQVALYDNLKILYPSPHHNAVSRYLSTINGMMGSMHDELVLQKFKSAHGYYADTFELSGEIRQRLLALAEKFAEPQ